jgi:inner membrane protein
MTAKSHIVTNFNIALLPLSLYPNVIFNDGFHSQYYIFVAGVLFGSLLPDIDEPNSFLGKRVEFFSRDLNLLIGHRTLTHNILLYLLVAVVSVYLAKEHYYEFFLIFGFCVGAIFHILEDCLTNSGVKTALQPLTKNFIIVPKSARFSTNGAFENFIYIPIVSTILIVQAFNIGQELF